MKKAYLLKEDVEGYQGSANLYRVDPPIEFDEWLGNKYKISQTKYIIISAVHATYSGPETYIFPANENGDVINWTELEGSFRGSMNIEKALRNIDYTVVSKK